MKKLFCLAIILTVLFSAGCHKNSADERSGNFNGSKLKRLTNNVLKGDRQANQTLALFESDKLPINQSYENMIVDSFKIDNKIYYYMLLQFPVPQYNRLAIYDHIGRPLLLDKSLNGDISLSFDDIDGIRFLKAVESFISKDALSVKRLSYYKLDSLSTKLSFRSFITLVEPNAILSQDISRFTKDTVYTTITLPSSIADKYAKTDTFIYDPSFNKYISRTNRFDEVVRQRVNDFNISKP